MDVGKDLSTKIMEALKPLLPKGTGFIMICASATEPDLGITSNLPDDIALQFLEQAIVSIETDPPELIGEESKTPKQVN